VSRRAPIRVQTEIRVTPAPAGAGVAIVVNPDAGPAIRRSPTEAIGAVLPEAEIIELDDGLELDDALDKAVASGGVIGMSGGDGSLNAAAGRAHKEGRPLLVLPGGTLNHFARDLGVDSIDDAAEAVACGRTVSVDLAEIAGRAFLNTASFGAYVDLVDARERIEHRVGKWPAALISLARVLRSSAPVDVDIDGRRREVWLIFIGNCRYQPAGFRPRSRARLDDGLLDIRVVDRGRRYARVRLLLSALTGRLDRSPIYDAWTAEEVRVTSHQGPLRLARDGETFDGPDEFVVTKFDEPLRVFAPEP